MLGQRRKWWVNIEPILYEHFVFAGMTFSLDTQDAATMFFIDVGPALQKVDKLCTKACRCRLQS